LGDLAADASTDIHAGVAWSWSSWGALGALAPDLRLNQATMRSLATKVINSIELLARLQHARDVAPEVDRDWWGFGSGWCSLLLAVGNTLG